MAGMNVDYIGQIFFQQDAEVRTWIKRLGSKSFTVGEELWQGDRHCARGTAVYVNYNFETQTSEPLSESIIAQLKRLHSDRQVKMD